MKNITKTFAAALAVLFSTLTFVACSNDEEFGPPPSHDEIVSHLKGKWKLMRKGEDECPTHERDVLTFEPLDICLHSYASDSYSEKQILWFSKVASKYKVTDGQIEMYDFLYDLTKDVRMYYKVLSINDGKIETTLTEVRNDGNVTTPNERRTYVKVTADYSRDILGTWIGTDHEGFVTEGDYNHRWEFKLDGTFVYYTKDAGDNWVPDSHNKNNKYVMDGDWLSTYWEYDGVKKQEQWDVEYLSNGQMKWKNYRITSSGETSYQYFYLKKE